jgi:pimeloyl-ACP methyl ester carboxylesterase
LTEFAITADGLRIAYCTAGEGPQVLLLHGFASSIEQNWGATGWLRTLGDAGFRVVALDFRGHGESDKPRDPKWYGAAMLLDILAVTEAAEAQNAQVMGYSMGGMLGIHFLLNNPARVKRLIVAGVGARYFSRPLHYSAISAALKDRTVSADPTAATFRKFASQRGKDPLALASCIEAEFPRHAAEELRRIDREVLVVCGTRDEASGPPEPLAKVFPNGHAVALPGRDHMSAVGDAGYRKAAVEFFGGGSAMP